jgi:hypothetical protein
MVSVTGTGPIESGPLSVMGCTISLTMWPRSSEQNGKDYHQSHKKTDKRNACNQMELFRSHGL